MSLFGCHVVRTVAETVGRRRAGVTRVSDLTATPENRGPAFTRARHLPPPPDTAPLLLPYGSERWTFMAEDSRELQSFHMSCQRQILGMKWYDHAKNSDIAYRVSIDGTDRRTDNWQIHRRLPLEAKRPASKTWRLNALACV